MSYQKGMKAEALAKDFLVGQGMRFIQQHYRSRFGEIDLIMQDKSDLVFVEVRLRKAQAYGSANESINWQKQRKIQLTAMQYLAKHTKPNAWMARFDVVSLQGMPPQIEWTKQAFEMR